MSMSIMISCKLCAVAKDCLDSVSSLVLCVVVVDVDVIYV